MSKMTTGPLGFPLPDKIASAVDAALKAVPADLRKACVSTITDAQGKRQKVDGYLRWTVIPKSVEFADGEHADISVVTSDSVDRDSEVVVPSGLDWSQFQRNPVVTFCHNYSTLPVGRSMWVKREQQVDGPDTWKAKTAYIGRPADHPEAEEWFPDTVWSYVREGYMPGKSIGFIPMEYQDPTPDDIRANPDLAECRWMITRAMILEYAVCPVQANVDALVESVSKMSAKGIASKSITDALGLVILDPAAKTPAAVKAKPKEGEQTPPPTTKPEPEPERKEPPIIIYDEGSVQAAAIGKAVAEVTQQIPAMVGAAIRDEMDRRMGRV